MKILSEKAKVHVPNLKEDIDPDTQMRHGGLEGRGA